MKWWERLAQAMEARRISPDALAERARVPVKSVYGYLNGVVDNPRGDVVNRLAKAVGMSELALRHGPQEDAAQVVLQLKKIPLIDMNKIGTLPAGRDALDAWDGSAVVSVPSDVPDGAYAMTLLDESNAPGFQKGDIIVCDPAAEVIPNRYVVAVLTDEKKAYFGRYAPATHGSMRRFRLEREGQGWPSIEVGTKSKGYVLARVTKHIRDV